MSDQKKKINDPFLTLNDLTSKDMLCHFLFPFSVPSGAPTKVKHTYNKETMRISFKWQLPLCGERHGEIVAYEYEFRQLLFNATFSDTRSGITDYPSTSFGNIPPDTICSFRVRASTSIGWGPFTTLKNFSAVESRSSKIIFLRKN